MEKNNLQERTKRFAVQIVHFVRKLPHEKTYWVIGDQLLRSGTSVGANTRAAYRGRSKKEFLAKMGLVVEEADESLFWLELLSEEGLCPSALQAELRALKKEANELTAIFCSICKKGKSES